MSRADREEQARREGMAYALRVAKEKGIDGLEAELRFRNATKLPTAVDRAICDECLDEIKVNVLDTVIVLMAATLYDEFDFGQKRVQRAIDRFEEKAECMSEGYCSWQDHIKMIKDNMGIELRIRMLEK